MTDLPTARQRRDQLRAFAHVFAPTAGVLRRLPSRNPANHLFPIVANPDGRACKRSGSEAMNWELPSVNPGSFPDCGWSCAVISWRPKRVPAPRDARQHRSGARAPLMGRGRAWRSPQRRPRSTLSHDDHTRLRLRRDRHRLRLRWNAWPLGAQSRRAIASGCWSSGRRWPNQEIPKTSWDVRKFAYVVCFAPPSGAEHVQQGDRNWRRSITLSATFTWAATAACSIATTPPSSSPF